MLAHFTLSWAAGTWSQYQGRHWGGGPVGEGEMGYFHLSKCQNLDNKPKVGSNYWTYFGKVLYYISILFDFSSPIEILTRETEWSSEKQTK